MWELCTSCHLDKWIEPGELVCHACATRGMGPPPGNAGWPPLARGARLRLMEPADTQVGTGSGRVRGGTGASGPR